MNFSTSRGERLISQLANTSTAHAYICSTYAVSRRAHANTRREGRIAPRDLSEAFLQLCEKFHITLILMREPEGGGLPLSTKTSDLVGRMGRINVGRMRFSGLYRNFEDFLFPISVLKFLVFLKKLKIIRPIRPIRPTPS